MRRTTESPRKGAVRTPMKPRPMWRLKGEIVYFQRLKAEEDCPRVQRQGPRRQEQRFKRTCYICNIEGYKANEYRSRLKKNKKNHPQANLTDHASLSLLAVVSEVNPTTNNKDWWVDTGATLHSCSEKLLFSEYQKLE